MSAAATVSLIIVNSGRRAELALALKGLEYLRHKAFEVIVISDLAPADRPSSRLAPRWIAFAERNISAARNLGIAAARGDVIAFIDDDAVPEFGWLDALTAPFADPKVGAAGGYVRGRNGVSFQWRAISVDRTGRDSALHLPTNDPVIFAPEPERFVKTVGTNSAFRRQALVGIGGFDQAYRFFLDETDVNLRLAAAGWHTAIVPLAEVHHGFAASDLRTRNRVPRSLFEIGASMAHFLDRHAPGAMIAARKSAFAEEQRKRLDRHLLLGLLSGGQRDALMAELHDGFDEGASRPVQLLDAPAAPPDAFVAAASPATGARRLFACGLFDHGPARAAAAAAAQGDEVTLIVPEASHRPLTVRFTEAGLFRHRFGLLGKSERNAARRIRTTFARIATEENRISLQRGPFLP